MISNTRSSYASWGQSQSTPQKSTSTYKNDSRFEKLYSISKRVSQEKDISLPALFNEALAYIDPQYNDQYILNALSYQGYGSYRTKNTLNPRSKVWLVIGETGMGKTTFINSSCGAVVAKEGQGTKSQTTEVDVYTSKLDSSLVLIDTPGFFDTRTSIKNTDIADQILKKVQNVLKEEANIEGIFFLWCPNYCMKLRLDEILENIKTALGQEAVKSIVFLVNKDSSLWRQNNEVAVKELEDDLKVKGLQSNPVILLDVKNLPSNAISELQGVVKKVQPYKKEYFEENCKSCLYKKYEVALHKYNKKVEKERLEKEAKEKEEEMKKKLEKEQREKEEIRRKADEEARRYQEQLRKNEEARKKAEEEASKKAEEDARKYEDLRRRQESLQRQIEESQRVSYSQPYSSFYGDFLSTSIFDYPGNGYSNLGSRSGYNDFSILFQPKSYYQPAPTQVIQNSVSSGQKFYKGGQFIPGGGRAPKGGGYY